MAARLSIRILGALAFEPEPSTRLMRGPRELAVYLAVHGATPRARIAHDLWPDVESSRGLFYLRRSVMELRRAYPDALTEPGYGSLAIEADAEDLRALRAAIAEGDPEQVLGTWKLGPLLTGIKGEWVDSLRSELAAGILATLRPHAIRQGGAGIDLLARLVDLNPTDEARWRDWMEALLADGRLVEARKVLARFERTVGRASEATLHLFRQPADRLARPIPAEQGEFVGRVQDLRRVREALTRSRWVTLVGPGGIGKTRLGCEVARQAEGTDAPIFVSLVDATSADEVRDRIAGAAGIRAERGASWRVYMARIRRSLGLLVLDNADELPGPTGSVVREILAWAPGMRVLVTSRQATGQPGERLLRLGPMDPHDAERLFQMRLAALTGAVLTPTLRSFCSELDGMPLAIELAVAQLGGADSEALSEDFRQQLALDGADPARQDRHRTMRAALQVSWARLSRPLREGLARLAVFRGGFDAVAGASVAGLSAPDFARLVSGSLLEFDGRRYRLLEPIRQFALEELRRANDEGPAQEAHARYFVGLATRAYEGPFPYDNDPAGFAEKQPRLLLDEPNFAAAIEHLRTTGRERTDDTYAIMLVRIWFRTLSYADPQATQWCWRLLEMPEAQLLSRLGTHWAFLVASFAEWNLDFPQRDTLYELAERLARRTEDWLALAYIARSRASQTFHHPILGIDGPGGEIAESLFHSLGHEVPAALTRIAGYWRQGADSPSSRDAADQDRRWARRRGYIRVEMDATFVQVVSAPGNDAKIMLEDLLSRQRQVSDPAISFTLSQLAQVARRSGSVREEVEAWQALYDEAKLGGVPVTQSRAKIEQARALARANDWPRAYQAAHEAIITSRALNLSTVLFKQIGYLAEIALREGCAAEARGIATLVHEAGLAGEFQYDWMIRGQIAEVGLGDPVVRFGSVDEVLAWLESRSLS